MPFNLQVQPTAGQSIGRGISKWLDIALNAYAEGKEETKALNDKASALDKLVKADKEILPAIGVDEEAWKGMGSREKVKAMDGYMEHLGIERVKSSIAQSREQTATMQSARAGREAEQAQVARALQQLQGANMPVPQGNAGVMGLPAMAAPAQGQQLQRMLGNIMAQNPQALAQIGEALKLQQSAGPQAARTMFGPQDIGHARPVPNLDGWSFVPTTANSGQLVNHKEREVLPPIELWQLTDNEDEFKQGLRRVQDPAVLEDVLKRRAAYKRALQTPDPLAELIAGLRKGTTTEEVAKGATQPKVAVQPDDPLGLLNR